MEATCFLGFKTNLHQWDEYWLKAIKHKDMWTFGSGRPWSANCCHVWDKDHVGSSQDPYSVPLLSTGRHVGDKWGGLTQEKSFLCHVILCVVQAYVFRRLFAFKYYAELLCKTANIGTKGPIFHLTIPFLCLHVSGEVNEVVIDCFVFPLPFGSFPAAVIVTAVGLI